MINHENGKSRLTYFTIKDGGILLFIPLSSKVDKYKVIVEKKKRKYGKCGTILIKKIKQREVAILIQNAFPTLEKYIDHPHMVNGQVLKVSDAVKDEIIQSFNYMMSMKSEGLNLFFTDIDKIKSIMLDEISIKS